jgi:tRNA(fMet)-specific endonuclease VapC
LTTTRYMLDTNTASHVIKGNIPPVRDHVLRLPMHAVCISVITEAELLYGVAMKPSNADLRTAVTEFILRLAILPWDEAAAVIYAKTRATLHRQGKPMGNMDLLIAAHALSINATLVTNDGTFKNIETLSLADWTR